MNSKTNKFLPHPTLSVVLLIVWLLLNNTIAAGHILLGSFLALAIPWLTAGFWQNKVCAGSPKSVLKFTIIVIYDIIIANITVAKLILGPNEKLRPAFFDLPIDIEHPLGISILASTISLTPGTVSCDLSADKKSLRIHALDLEDEAQTIQEIKHRYEKPLLEVFKPC